MKNLFITLGNIWILMMYFCVNLFEVIWHGKLPKVSAYHQWHFESRLTSRKQIYEDKDIQSKISD